MYLNYVLELVTYYWLEQVIQVIQLTTSFSVKFNKWGNLSQEGEQESAEDEEEATNDASECRREKQKVPRLHQNILHMKEK